MGKVAHGWEEGGGREAVPVVSRHRLSINFIRSPLIEHFPCRPKRIDGGRSSESRDRSIWGLQVFENKRFGA